MKNELNKKNELANQKNKDLKNKALKTMANLEFYPEILDEKVNISNHTKIPISGIAGLGVSFEPLANALRSAIDNKATVTNLYRVTIPKGRELAKVDGGTAYIGSVLKKNGAVGGGQARLNPILINPNMLFMAAALASVEKKLDDILEIQKEILAFLSQKERSELKGDFNFLTDILKNYKYNWNNDKYKNSNHIKVLDIRQGAERKIDFYRQQIKSKLNKKFFLHTEKQVKRQLEKIQEEFQDYQLALYIFSFSSFIEVMLLENYDSEYLYSITDKIVDYSFEYRELYTKSYNQIEKNTRSSIEFNLVNKAASLNIFLADALADKAIFEKYQIDEKLTEAGEKLGEFGSNRIEDTMKMFVDKQTSYVRPFIENINTINMLYNHPTELVFDEENIYLEVVG